MDGQTNFDSLFRAHGFENAINVRLATRGGGHCLSNLLDLPKRFSKQHVKRINIDRLVVEVEARPLMNQYAASSSSGSRICVEVVNVNSLLPSLLTCKNGCHCKNLPPPRSTCRGKKIITFI